MLELLFIDILSMSTIASIVFLIILIARKCIKDKVNQENTNLLWIIFMIVLFIPLNFQSYLSIKNFVNLDKTYVLTESIQLNNEILHKDDGNIISEDTEKLDLQEIASIVWISVALSLIVADGLIYKSLNVKKSIEIPEKVSKILKECQKELNIEKDIQIVIQDKIQMPSLYVIFNTKILLTEEILNFSDNELKCIVAHELNHYKRNHHIFYIIFNILERIHWFNPIIKLAFKTIKQDLEIITDNSVLKTNITVKEYCMAILKITELCNLKENKMPSICSGKKEIERRIIQMKNNNIKNSIFIIVATILAVSVLTISFASDKVTKANNENIEMIGEIFSELDKQEEIIPKVEYIVPIEYTNVSLPFGTRIHPITKEEMTHTGIDLAAKEGTKVKAAASGVVEVATFDNEKGNYVEIKHIDGSVSSYHHGSTILVEVGDSVQVGEEIMIVGKTGNATGTHLHFEVRNANNEYMDVNVLIQE